MVLSPRYIDRYEFKLCNVIIIKTKVLLPRA